jgi:hypothetical protein
MNNAKLYDVDYWSLPREMAMDDALRDIATRVILRDEHGARMTAIEVFRRLEPRTQEHENAIDAKLKPLPNEGSAWPYEVPMGGDPQWDYVIPPDELALLRRRDAEWEAKCLASTARHAALRDQLQQQQPPPLQPEPEQPPSSQPPPIANSTQENMQHTTKRVIAREWLTFLVLLVVGLTIAPLVVITIMTKEVKLTMLAGFYEGLFAREVWVPFWLIALAPYIIYQLGRSLVWAVKTAKGR